MRIVIGNLPDKVSEEEIREALEQFAAGSMGPKVETVCDSGESM
jgi:hypothetical protein